MERCIRKDAPRRTGSTERTIQRCGDSDQTRRVQEVDKRRIGGFETRGEGLNEGERGGEVVGQDVQMHDGKQQTDIVGSLLEERQDGANGRLVGGGVGGCGSVDDGEGGERGVGGGGVGEQGVRG